jgi:putative tricarboxylic transport membrane protein
MTVAIAILFIRFAYVSLPRGEPPFDRFTDLVRLLIGA